VNTQGKRAAGTVLSGDVGFRVSSVAEIDKLALRCSPKTMPVETREYPIRGILLAEAVANKQDSVTLGSLLQGVFLGDISAIRRADVLLAILDGRAVDEGTAFEVGFAYAIDKPCYGLQTDPRRLLPQGNNPMISQSLKCVFADLEELRAWSVAYRAS